MTAAIEVAGLAKRFRDVVALDGLELTAATGEVLGLVGPNGAGKTTFLRILTTLLRPDAGVAKVLGYNVVADPFAVRRRIGLAGQFAAVDPMLTGRENLVMVGRLYHLRRAEAVRRAAEVLERFGLGLIGDRRASTYSGGMRRRLDLAATLVGRPELIFLDEPTTGLDPRGRASLWEIVAELRREGATVVLTTQYLEEADRLAQRIAVINRGRIVASGTAADLKALVGADRLVIRLVDPQRASAGAAALRALCPDADPAAGADGELALPLTSPSLPAAAVRALDRIGADIVALEIRRPTLDDAFLHLTGHRADANGHGA